MLTSSLVTHQEILCTNSFSLILSQFYWPLLWCVVIHPTNPQSPVLRAKRIATTNASTCKPQRVIAAAVIPPAAPEKFAINPNAVAIAATALPIALAVASI